LQSTSESGHRDASIIVTPSPYERAHRPFCTLAHRSHPHRQRANGAVELGVCQTKGRPFCFALDDTDVARSKQEYAIGIEQNLQWLGILPGIIVRQSDRAALYDRPSNS
jgi:hypothetical protein